MSRTESEESTESPFASVLNTPADEEHLHFDVTDRKLLSDERLAHGREADHWQGRPHRVSLSRQFAKALDEATKSTNSHLDRRSVDRVHSEPESPASPNLMSFASPELPSESRVHTPEPPISDTYNTGSPQSIVRTTPRGRPPLLRDIFSPAIPPIPFSYEDQIASSVPESTPRPHSTLRHRKGMYSDLNDSITGRPASEVLSDADLSDVSHDANAGTEDDAVDAAYKALLLLDDDDDCTIESEAFLDTPAMPRLSPLFPLQLVFFPIWCALVGGVILFCPTYLDTLAFPASAPRSSAYTVAFMQRGLAQILPFVAPPTPIRAFAYWATVAHLHVAILLATLAGVVYAYPPLGALLVVASAALFARAWCDFVPLEEFSGDLGGDDGEVGGRVGEDLGGEARQMLYQVLAPGCGFRDGDKLRRVGGRYFLVHAPRRAESRAEILAAGGLSEEYNSDDSDESEE